jgi:hypothetical protein
MRPSKLNAEVQDKIVQLVSSGVHPEVAAGAFGIDRSTFYEWMQRGEGEHSTRPPTARFVAFAAAVRKAIALSEVSLVLKLGEFIRGTRPGKRDPKRRVRSRLTAGQIFAAQWSLSRRFPDRWGQRAALPAVAVDAIESDDESGGGFIINVNLDPPRGSDAPGSPAKGWLE